MKPGALGRIAAISLALMAAVVTPVVVTPLVAADDAPQADVDRPPVPVHISKPRYPEAAFRKGISGTVELEILIDKTGRVAKTRVMKSIAELDAAAIQCVMEWRFRPAQKDGQPVATVASAPVTFRVTKKK